MAIRYKIDVLDALKQKGYNTNWIRQNKIMGQATLQQLRAGELVSWLNMERLCKLLECQPGDLLEYVPADSEGEQ